MKECLLHLGRLLQVEVVVSDEAVRRLFGIVSGVIEQDRLCQGEDADCRAVDKISIVGDIQDSALVGVERIFQDFLGDHIQMIGGLVQDQEVGLGEHELGQGYASLLAAAQIADPLEDFLACEEEGSQKAADLCVVHGRVLVGDLLEHGLIVVQYMMLLVVVADVNICPQTDHALVRRDLLVEDTQDRGLSGAVVSDQGDVFPPTDLEGEAGEKCLFTV